MKRLRLLTTDRACDPCGNEWSRSAESFGSQVLQAKGRGWKFSFHSKRCKFVADGVIRLVVIDDHLLMREGLVEILDSYDDLEVAGVAGDSESALAVLSKQKPDVAI